MQHLEQFHQKKIYTAINFQFLRNRSSFYLITHRDKNTVKIIFREVRYKLAMSHANGIAKLMGIGHGRVANGKFTVTQNIYIKSIPE